MSLKNLTVNEVRMELADIISRYPNRTGGTANDYGTDCVYFKNEDGDDISNSSWEYSEFDPLELVTPVCIVGQWVYDFHPELKLDDDFQSILFRNAVLSTAVEASRVLSPEVHELLGEIQGQQDDGRIWKDLDLYPEMEKV